MNKQIDLDLIIKKRDKMRYLKKQSLQRNKDTENNTKCNGDKFTFLDEYINIRAILSTYYLGTGPIDIGNALSLLGIPGGHTFKGLFMIIWIF